MPLFFAGSGIKKKEIRLLFFCPDAKSVLLLWAASLLFLRRVSLQKTAEGCFSLVVVLWVFHWWYFLINTTFLISSFQQLQEAQNHGFYTCGKNISHFDNNKCFSTKWKFTSRATKSTHLPMAVMMKRNWTLWKGIRIRLAALKWAAKLGQSFLKWPCFILV